MPNYTGLKEAISNVIKENGNQEITGSVLQNVLNSMVSIMGENRSYVSIAIPSLNPGNPDGNVFYLATEGGIYSNFSGLNISGDELAIIYNTVSGWEVSYLGVLTSGSLENFQEIISEIESKIDLLREIKSTNYINPQTVTLSYMVNGDTGVLTPASQYNSTDYIEITPSVVYTGLRSYGNESGVNMFRTSAFYDENKVFISGNPNPHYTFIPPSNAKYLRLSLYNTYDMDGYGLFQSGSPVFTLYKRVLGLNYSVPTLNKEDDELAIIQDIKVLIDGVTADFMHAKDVASHIKINNIVKDNLLNPNTVLPNCLLSTVNGGIDTGGVSANYDTTDYISVVPGTSYKGLKVGNLVQSFRKGTYYDISKNFISGFDSMSTFTPPSNAVFFRGSVSNTVADYSIANIGIFLSSINVFEPYLSGVDLELIGQVSTSLKNDNSITTIKDVKELISSSSSENLLSFIKSNNQISVNSPKGTIVFNLYANGNQIANFGSTIFKDVNINNTDDVAPAHIMSTTLGANHGQPFVRATLSEPHGLGNSSIGSEWLHSDGKKYYIVEIFSPTVLGFLSEPTGDREDFTFANIGTGTITNNGNTLNISSIVTAQFYPGVLDHNVKILSNGKDEITINGEYKTAYVDVVERYTIKNTYDILMNLIANTGTSTPVYDGSKMLTFENIYRFIPNGTVFVITNMIAEDNIKFQDYMFSQATKIATGNPYYYVPNSLPVSTYDFRKPLAVSWSGSVPSIKFGQLNWKDSNNPVNRIIQYYLNTGFIIGYLRGVGVGVKLDNYTANTFEIRNNTGKIYPHGVDSEQVGISLQKGAIYNAVIYRSFTDLSESRIDNRLSMFNFTFDNSEYIIIDYSDNMLDRVIINDSLNGSKIEIIESSNTTLGSDIYNNGIYVKADYVEGETCFIVLKLNYK